MALKGGDCKTDRARTSQKARTSEPQGVSNDSRIQRDKTIFVTTGIVTNNYTNVRREIKCHASDLKTLCSY